MSVADEIVSKSNGARFYRADLHIHSFGVSHDVTDTAMTTAGILQTAEREGLTLISITDHNEIASVLGAVELSKRLPLVVIAGVELSTPQGHLLAYFPDYDRLANFYGRLQIEGKGTPQSRCQTSLLECLSLSSSMGGIGILAHVDGPGGFEAAQPRNTPHKEDVIVHPGLLGIELRSAASTISYGYTDPDPERAALGKSRTKKLGLGQGQQLARVLFSDSHSLAALGYNAQGSRRVTRIKMDQPSFEGLRLALVDPDARVRLEDEIPLSVPYIMGVKLEGGFLDGQIVHFSRNLTCIIGGRGAGKSTLFEAARSAAETPSESPLVDSEVWPQSLHLVWVDETGQQQIIERGICEAPRNLGDPDLGPIRFPVECYGQGETAETSNQARTDPAALLDYLDQFIDFKDFKTQEATARDSLLRNQSEIEKAKIEVSKIPQYTRSLATTRQQLQALETANAKDVVALERNVAEERAVREMFEQKIARCSGEARELGALAISAEIKDMVVPAEWKIAGEEYKAFVAALERFERGAVATQEALASSAATFAQEASNQLKAWKAKEQQITTQIEGMRRQLAAQGVRLDLAYIRKLTSDEANYTKTLETLNKWEKNLKDLQKQREELLATRAKWRSAITAARVAFAVKASSQLDGALGDLHVSVKFLPDGLSREAEQQIQQAMGWRTVQVQRASILGSQITIPRLLEIIQKKDAKKLSETADPDGDRLFSLADAREIVDRLAEDQYRFALERCPVDDVPKITVTKEIRETGQKPRYLSKDFARLSLGQQQSVLLSLMLASSSSAPLVIDQPEDNLDGEFIYHSLVPALRTAKERRQVIIVTHNPNIAVLGDAEEIVALKSTSDKSVMVANGSIDDPKTKAIACQILEGAEDAFRRRALVYGI